MPPRTRTRATKDLKENVNIVKKIKIKSDGKISKPPRKALADKTNSLSDDNSSIDVPIKTSKVILKSKTVKSNSNDENRPRRERRLPTRYVENHVLKNLSNNASPVKHQSVDVSEISYYNSTTKERQVKQLSKPKVLADRPKRNRRLVSAKQPLVVEKPKTPSKQISNNISPFKTPSQSLDSSLIASRPKRISRLPSKFEDHSISPSKFIPVQPCHASTPLIQKNAKTQKTGDVSQPVQEKRPKRNIVKKTIKATPGSEQNLSKTSSIPKNNNPKDLTSSSEKNTSSDTNNNPKGKRVLAKKVISTKSSTKQISPKAKPVFGKRLLEQNLSFRVFEDKKSDKGGDVYEFTFDPCEEPVQKKKKRKVVRKKPSKPKTIVVKSSYDKNLKKALESLKNKVKPQAQSVTEPKIQQKESGKIKIIEDVVIKPAVEKSLNKTPAKPTNESAKSIHMSNYASIHIEDIAADFEMDNDDLNYSPVNSPFRPKTPDNQLNTANSIGKKINHKADVGINPVVNKDPLNLQEDLSFFEDQPVASSSMNVSVRHPLASPWRVEFGNLPIKWQANTYVKPNMTPAVESSFINSEEISKKKHVYTNLLTEDPMPRIEEPQLKQTSIISFMKEAAERSLKKKRGRSISPTKANSLFEDSNASDFGFKTPKKARKDKVTPNKSTEKENNGNQNEISNNSNKSSEKESNENHNEISNENLNHEENIEQKKSKENKDGTFFGFDESEDQENVSPVKVKNTGRGLRSKSRAVLKEINALTGPTRALLPVSTKSKLPNADVVEKMYDQLKAADVAPQVQEKETVKETVTNDADSSDNESVHLFEDIELIHHLKPQRKSYGKAKKVTFRQASNSDSDTQTQAPEVGSSDEDDLADLTFHMPNVKEKKVTKKKKKKQLSKKEEKEVEEWAAGFNSMCEDIDEFPLIVE